MDGIGTAHGRIVALGSLRTGVIEIESERDHLAFAHEACSSDDVLRTGVIEGADFVFGPPFAPILVLRRRVAKVLTRDLPAAHSFFLICSGNAVSVCRPATHVFCL